MDAPKVMSFVEDEWKSSILDALSEFIKIPNQSPQFDPDVLTNGFQEKALDILINWMKSQEIEGLTYKVVQVPDRTPVLLITIQGEGKTDETVLMYGHMDKQPPMESGWMEGLGPHKPVVRDGKLYGRGGADDGYAIFASLCAIKALKAQKVPHGRIVVLIEASEESGSRDLPFYIEKLASEIGDPSLVICLDSGCGNYDTLWLTTSLRGMLAGELKVEILTEGVHSGGGSGIVPSSFRIMRELLDRIEDKKTGRMLPELYCEIPKKEVENAKAMAKALGDSIYKNFPFVKGAKPVVDDIAELLLNRTWRPTLSITGQDGMPSIQAAGNVLRSHTSLMLSIRLPPLLKPEQAEAALRKVLEHDVPYNAKVTFNVNKGSQGWYMPPMSPWLEKSVEDASLAFFKAPPLSFGEGGSIPFMGMLGARYPNTQFVILGLLGPGSNAHGPNEFLHIKTGERLTAGVALILERHYKHAGKGVVRSPSSQASEAAEAPTSKKRKV